MINLETFEAVLAAYKEYFPSHWKDEKYKWEAIKHFQDHWDINAPDFASMFETATEKTYNLLASGYFYPKRMILNFAKADAEATRAMFIKLYDETKDLAERVDQFQIHAENMRAEHDDGAWKNHYQNTNAISTYLWLRFPNKYYIYKYSECVTVAKELKSDFVPKRNSSAKYMVGGYKLYNEICKHLQKDAELASLLQSSITENCYPDNELTTMTIDVGFFISRFYSQKIAEDGPEWFPSDYKPNLTVDDWKSLLEDKEVYTVSSLEIMKRMKDYGGMATCTQLSIKFGETKNFYNSGSSALAKRIANKTGCPVMQGDTENSKWWPILYVGRRADQEAEGYYTWKLRDELSEALDKIDLTDIPLYANVATAVWKISHGTDFFSAEETKIFESKRVIVVHKDTKAKATSKVSQGENFMQSMKIGDYFYLCFGNSIRLLGQVTSDAVLNPEKKDGWYQREYEVIANSNDTTPYNNIQKWWTPNDNSTCVMVGESDKVLFEELILKPYFDITLDSLLNDRADTRGYWWLNANPKIWSFSDIDIGQVQSYTLYNDNGNKRRIFQNFLDAKAGDMIIGYACPMPHILALPEPPLN